jgi:hypothetical protein
MFRRLSLDAASGDYPNPWNHKVFNLILQVEFPAGKVIVTEVTEDFR